MNKESWKKCISVSTKILSTTVFNIDKNKNVSWAANQHIRRISEGTCDTEDTERLLKIQLCHHNNKLHLKIYYNRVILSCNNITVLLYFWSNKCSLGEHKRLFSFKTLTDPKLKFKIYCNITFMMLFSSFIVLKWPVFFKMPPLCYTIQVWNNMTANKWQKHFFLGLSKEWEKWVDGSSARTVSQCRLTSSHPSGIGCLIQHPLWHSLTQAVSVFLSLSVFLSSSLFPCVTGVVFQLTWSWIVRALAYLHSPQSSLRSGTASTDTLVLKLGSHWVTLIGLARWRDLKPNHKHITLDFTSRRQCRAWRSTKRTHLTDQQHAPSKALRVPL